MRPLASPLRSRLLLATCAALLAACSSNQAGPGRPGGPGGPRGQRAPGDTMPMAAPNTTARADLRDVNGNSVGTITLTQTMRGVLLTGDVSSMPPGLHALHVHDVGRCEPPFTSAGGHLNPGQRTHGYRSSNGNHAGDLPNFAVAANGTAHIELLSRDLTLAPGFAGVFDPDGTSIVVHAGTDDYQSDPAGNSGNRMACGVITR